MKKLFFLALSGLLLLTACEGPEGPMGPPGPKGSDGSSNWDVYTFTVKASDWSLSGTPDAKGSYFYYDLTDDIGALTAFVADKGNVSIYAMYKNEADKYVYSPLPLVRFYGETDTYTQTYDYEYQKDKIRFAITRSDFKTSLPANQGEDITYKIVYTW